MNKQLTSFLNRAFKMLLSYGVLALLFFGFRISYTLRFGDKNILSAHLPDLFKAFALGLKFDTMVICYAFSFVLFLSLIQLFIKGDKVNLFFDRISIFWITLCGAVFCFILVADHQFYSFFQSHINILAFGFIEDDTKAVLKSMWTDHPIILLSFIILIITIIIYFATNRIWKSNFAINFLSSKGVLIKWLLVLLYIMAFAFGGRGNLTKTFPLQKEDSVVSDNQFINKLALNGAFTLSDAINEHSEELKPITKDEVLGNNGYSSAAELLSEYFDRPSSDFVGPDYEKYLFKTTEADSLLEKKQYNVVFVMMESLGSYYFNFHSDSLNLLGKFEKHLNEDYHFTNFLSSTRGTIYSLESTLINKDSYPISNTSLRFKTFNSSVAFPYQELGYETFFISGGRINWRNLDEFLPKQYFSQVYGQSIIMRNNKLATKNTWGVHDEFLFDEIFNQLSKNPSTPKMICALSTTNHTPYELPKGYQAFPINIPDSIKNIILANHSIAEKSFLAYQYANNCLGEFLDKLKNSALGNNTIVAISGDHTSYSLFPYDATGIEEINKHKVPFYLYVPEALKKPIYSSFTNRYGSHKDIFPTLFNLSISNQKYFTLGNNLFSSNIPDSLFYAINDSYSIGSEALSQETLQKKVKTRSLLIKYYFAFTADSLGNKSKSGDRN